MSIVRLLVLTGVTSLVSCQSVPTEESTALVLPDVHDPAQLVRMGDAFLLYASPVEWWAYSLDDRGWYFLGDDLYGGNNPDGDLGDAAYWAPVDDYVVESDGYDQPFAIDPAVFADDEGRHWLVYGSMALPADGLHMASHAVAPATTTTIMVIMPGRRVPPAPRRVPPVCGRRHLVYRNIRAVARGSGDRARYGGGACGGRERALMEACFQTGVIPAIPRLR